MEQKFSHPGEHPRANFEANSFWDQRYAAEGYIYGTQPNVFFQSVMKELQPGKLLLPAEGEGRNAVYAAQQGWMVHAFDFSNRARDKALTLAKKKTVDIRYDLAKVENFESGERFDLIAMIFLHLGPEGRAEIFQRYARMLRPGGQLIGEFFNTQQLGNTSGGPKKAEWLIDRDELAATFNNFTIIYLNEVEVHLDEGPYHAGKANTTRVIVQQ